jgi:hypothetical protein
MGAAVERRERTLAHLANTVAGQNPAGTSANAYNAARCDLAAVRALNLVPATGNIPIGSIPYDYKQVEANVSGDYRLGRASSSTPSSGARTSTASSASARIPTRTS